MLAKAAGIIYIMIHILSHIVDKIKNKLLAANALNKQAIKATFYINVERNKQIFCNRNLSNSNLFINMPKFFSLCRNSAQIACVSFLDKIVNRLLTKGMS